ncbi:MAG: Uncharacterized protein XD74_2148 [Actinobacteria bacterium 66_15]|nr:MAG: Uncharacterized protein XD74_2148 [Actinobacteria bacterium 66_15]
MHRFIPTCMGNALHGPYSSRPTPVHPHVHGERPCWVRRCFVCTGSSPRAWGTPYVDSHSSIPDRFIPTCMGNACRVHDLVKVVAVHPHVHGERFQFAHTKFSIAGSSPRAWGTLYIDRNPGPGFRFIPTCMGNAHPFLFQKGGRLLPPIQTQDQRFVMRNLGIA